MGDSECGKWINSQKYFNRELRLVPALGELVLWEGEGQAYNSDWNDLFLTFWQEDVWEAWTVESVFLCKTDKESPLGQTLARLLEALFQIRPSLGLYRCEENIVSGDNDLGPPRPLKWLPERTQGCTKIPLFVPSNSWWRDLCLPAWVCGHVGA